MKTIARGIARPDTGNGVQVYEVAIRMWGEKGRCQQRNSTVTSEQGIV
jgi:hypothetical protein